MSVADILPYYFRLENTAALLIEGPLQLYSTQHATSQQKAIIPTPNSTTAKLAGGKRSHGYCQPGTLCGHRELSVLWHARRAIVLSILFIGAASRIFLLFSITRTAILYVGQCTTSGLPHESRHIFRALRMNLAHGQAQLCCCDFIFLRAEAHTDDDKPLAREKLVHWFLHTW